MNLDVGYLPKQLEILEQIKPDTKYLVITKGRRFGITQFMAHYFTELIIEGEQLLWGDTIHSNIDRYVERYFMPLLKKNNLAYNYNRQKKTLTLDQFKGYIDFRSADKPENWEGFGYHKIYLNEAGIILKNDYLYTNAVLPMLLDFPQSMLIAAGVPKGRTKKDGKPHKFYDLANAAKAGDKGFQMMSFSSYDNNLLAPADIEDLEGEIRKMNEKMVQQEIYGEFVDGAGGVLWDEVMIHRCQANEAPALVREIVAIDPATTSTDTSDETGIVHMGKCANGNIWILDDLSGKYTPEGWAKVVTDLKRRHKIDAYVAEKNQGGDMVQSILRQFDKQTRIKLVTATKGKYVRAEPVYSLYEQNKVFHVGRMPLLEQQMTYFNPESKEGSPDRVDALVWGVTELSAKHHIERSTSPGPKAGHHKKRL